MRRTTPVCGTLPPGERTTPSAPPGQVRSTLVIFPNPRRDLLACTPSGHPRPLTLPSQLPARNVRFHDRQQSLSPTNRNHRPVLYGLGAAVEPSDVARPTAAPPRPRPIHRWRIPRQTLRPHAAIHDPGSSRIHSRHTDTALPDGPIPRPRPPFPPTAPLTHGPIHHGQLDRRSSVPPPADRRYRPRPRAWTPVTPHRTRPALRRLSRPQAGRESHTPPRHHLKTVPELSPSPSLPLLRDALTLV